VGVRRPVEGGERKGDALADLVSRESRKLQEKKKENMSHG